MWAGWPDMSRDDDLPDTLEGLGLGGLGFCKFGMLRLINLEWLRNALTRQVQYV